VIDSNPHPALTEAQIDIAVLKTQLSAVTSELAQVKRTLEDVRELLTEARGGWKLLMLLGGGAAAVGGFVVWFFSHNITIGPK
jgi:prefoldin subunit 5